MPDLCPQELNHNSFHNVSRYNSLGHKPHPKKKLFHLILYNSTLAYFLALI